MRASRVCPEEEALQFIASGKDKNTSSGEPMELKGSRWKDAFENLEQQPDVITVDGLVFNSAKKIAQSKDAEIFPGLFQNCPVAVKQVPLCLSQEAMKMASLLISNKVEGKHLLQPLSVLKESASAYFVFPLCEYNLHNLIEDKDETARQGLTKQRRLRICQDFLLGLQELHSNGILHRNLRPENILFDINHKLYIADFGVSRKLPNINTAGSWPCFEDCRGPTPKYEKESEIQVAGCMVHYILTDGQHPYQAKTPYSRSILIGLLYNVSMGNFTLQCEAQWTNLKDIIARMLSKECPTIEECLQVFMSVASQCDLTGTSKSPGNDNGNEDGANSPNSFPATPHESDILTLDSDQPDMTDSNLIPTSSSLNENGLSASEMDQTHTADGCPETPQEMDISESADNAQQERTGGPGRSRKHRVFIILDEEDKYQHEAEGNAVTPTEPPPKTPKLTVQSDPQPGIEVKSSSHKSGKMIYDKKHYCYYCEKPYGKITRHLRQKHCDESEVAKALGQRKGSTQQNLLLTKVRNMGNYRHYCSVQLVPKRQAVAPRTHTDYRPCKFCYAMYIKTDLRKHHMRCKLQVKEDGPVKAQASSSLMSPLDTSISKEFKEVVENMSFDDVTEVVQSDALVLQFGERMFRKNIEVDICNNMTEIARLLQTARQIDKDIISLKDLIKPRKFDTVLEAVKTMTGFDNSTHRFADPSTVLNLRHSLVMVLETLLVEALRKGDMTVGEEVCGFSSLIKLEWTNCLSSNALKTLKEKKWNTKGKTLEELTPNLKSEEDCSDSDADEVHSEHTASTRRAGKLVDGHDGESPGTSREAVQELNSSSLQLSHQKEKRQPWSTMERETLERHFKNFLKAMIIPGKVDCQRFLDKYPNLRDDGRDWKAVKCFVYNKITAIKRSSPLL